MQFSLLLAAILLTNFTKPDALTLLNNVSDQYARSRTYHIEAIEERTLSNELSRQWQKTFLTVAIGPNGQYRYEGRSGQGAAILISDGTSIWDYHLNEHLYTQTLALSPSKTEILPTEEIAVENAKHVFTDILLLPSRINSAKILPDETLKVAGIETYCNVIQFTNADLKDDKSTTKMEETVWIDKSKNTIIKIHRMQESYTVIPFTNARIPIIEEITTVYPIVDLDGQPPSSFFSFSPPPDAKKVEMFPGLQPHQVIQRPDEFVGKPAPDIALKASDGRIVKLTTFRGKPLFIDFWATWCAACIDLIPELKKLNVITSAKGIVWISVDSDEIADTAATLIAREQIPWSNYHDEDGSLGKAFGRTSLPLGVLINSDGKIVFYKPGYNLEELRLAFGGL